MDDNKIQLIVEGAILAAGKSLSIRAIEQLFLDIERPSKVQIEQTLAAIALTCEERGFELKKTASGYRFQVRQELSAWVNRLWDEKPQRYSRALLETLALVAYRQPVTRGDIEDVRGVSVSSQIIKTLLEREWVRVVGHRDVPGRPALYATTRQFLDYFNLSSLDELPPLSEIRDIEELSVELNLTAAELEDFRKAEQQSVVAEESSDLEGNSTSEKKTEDVVYQHVEEVAVNSTSLFEQPDAGQETE